MSDFWAQPTTPRARKPHKCTTCYRTIEPGETYSRGFGVYDGHPTSWAHCLHCKALLPRIDFDDTFSDEDFINWEPQNIAELRVKVHYNRKWRNNAGDLYPLPFEVAS